MNPSPAGQTAAQAAPFQDFSSASLRSESSKHTQAFTALDEKMRQLLYIADGVFGEKAKGVADAHFVDREGNVDKRAMTELGGRLRQVMDRFGLGPALLAAYLQGIKSGYLQNLPQTSTESVEGETSRFVYIPVRSIRGDVAKLQAAGIFGKVDTACPEIKHGDGVTCFYCSAPRFNVKEILIPFSIHGEKYEAGFTFSPFGDPLSKMHFVVWSKGKTDQIKNMDLLDHTFSELISMTEVINTSLAKFAERFHAPFVPITGIFNGWGGNSIYHQHFQFFSCLPPVLRPGKEVLAKGGARVRSITNWPSAIYEVSGDNVISLGDCADVTAAMWRDQTYDGQKDTAPLLSKTGAIIDVPNRTQNLIVPGAEEIRRAYFVPRQRELLDFINPNNVFFPGSLFQSAPGQFEPSVFRKANIGSLEVFGEFVVDDRRLFEALKLAEPAERDAFMQTCLAAIRPPDAVLAKFERSLS